MPGRLISVFGTYDFLGKSLPGMTLIIGLAALVPKGAFPFPAISENFLVVLSILLIVGLIGTLIGEFVHSLADVFEMIVGWILRSGWRLLYYIYNHVPFGTNEALEPSVLVIEIDREDEETQHDKINDRRSRGRKLYDDYRNWMGNQISKIAYVVWPHRKVFSKRLSVIEDDDFRIDRDIPGSGFAEEFFIKEIVVSNYNVRSATDTDQIYPVVVTTLSEANYDRPFRFQARYSFCRSMWLVLTVLGCLYAFFTISSSHSVLSLMWIEQSYISDISTLGMLSISGILLFASVVFAFTSGAYKKYYIDYLISGMYVLNQTSGQGIDIESPPQRAS